MSVIVPRLSTFWRSALLALGHTILWSIVHRFSGLPDPGGSYWIAPQLVSSFLIFFTLNGVFASFQDYRWGFVPQLMVAFFYVHPIFQVLYYQTYKTALDQQILSLVLREPKFLFKVFASEMTFFRAMVLCLGTAAIFFLQRTFLKRRKALSGTALPYDFMLRPWARIFLVVMVVLQIKWCLDHDPSMLIMRPLYPIVLMMLVSIIVYMTKVSAPVWERVFVMLLLFANIGQLYAFNLGFGDYRRHFTLDSQYYRSLFGAYFVQAGFGALGQDESAHAKYLELPAARMDYNILLVVNDTQRWDKLSSNGFSRATDDELAWFYEKSFNFKFPVSPSNSTDTSIPALLSGFSSDEDIGSIKGNLVFWDYFSKGAQTFFITSQDVTWSRLNVFYQSYGLKHLWNATGQPEWSGNPEDVDDILSYNYMANYVPPLKAPWVGMWQTFASHFPYTVPAALERYQPCDRYRDSGLDKFENCYLNAQVYSAKIRSDLFKKIDLENTVVVLTSDHGEGLGEHGVFFHGMDYHQEVIKVPFNIHIPSRLLEKLPPSAVENMKRNVSRVVSSIDILPTLLHLHEMLSGQKLHQDLASLTGRSLFTDWEHRVVFASGCFPQYRCYNRETLFVDDEYYVIFRPSDGFYKIYSTWGDLEQKNALAWKDIDLVKFERLVEEAARQHSAGVSMKAYYQMLKQNDFKSF